MILQIEGMRNLVYYDNISNIDISRNNYETADKAMEHFHSKDKHYQLIEDKETKGKRTYKAIGFWQGKEVNVVITNCTFYILNDKGKTINISGFSSK